MFAKTLEFYKVDTAIDRLESLVYKKGTHMQSTRVNGKDKEQDCFELQGVSFILHSWDDRDETLEKLSYDLDFAEQDFQDRMSSSPVNPGKAIDLDMSGVLSDNLQENGKLNYTYSERIYFQIDWIINQLRTNPETRQAYLSIWDPKLDYPNIGHGRVPCSLGYQFMIRDGKLNMIYIMRSLKINGCIGNDIYTATRMLETIAENLGLACGDLQFFCCSLHILE